MLRLYDTRRESRSREAREWFLGGFHPTSAETLMQQVPRKQEKRFHEHGR